MHYEARLYARIHPHASCLNYNNLQSICLHFRAPPSLFLRVGAEKSLTRMRARASTHRRRGIYVPDVNHGATKREEKGRERSESRVLSGENSVIRVGTPTSAQLACSPHNCARSVLWRGHVAPAHAYIRPTIRQRRDSAIARCTTRVVFRSFPVGEG